MLNDFVIENSTKTKLKVWEKFGCALGTIWKPFDEWDFMEVISSFLDPWCRTY